MKKQFLMAVVGAMIVGAGCAPTSSFPDKNKPTGNPTENPAGTAQADASKDKPADQPTGQVAGLKEVDCNGVKVSGIFVQVSSKAEIDKESNKDRYVTVKGKAQTKIFVNETEFKDPMILSLLEGVVHSVEFGENSANYVLDASPLTFKVPGKLSAETKEVILDPSKSKELPIILKGLANNQEIAQVVNCRTSVISRDAADHVMTVVLDMVAVPKLPEAPKTEAPQGEAPKGEEVPAPAAAEVPVEAPVADTETVQPETQAQS